MSGDTAKLNLLPILTFVIGALVLNLGLSTWWRAHVLPAHKTSQLDRAFLNNQEPLELLVAGDSHARNAVQDHALSGTLNVAVAGETWLKSAFRVPWLLDRSERPVERVMLGLDHASFSSWKTQAWQPEVVWGRYVDFLALGRATQQRLPYTGRWLKATLVPYAGELETLGQLLRGTRQFQQQRKAPLVPREHRRTGRQAAQLHLLGQDPFDPAQLWAFDRLMTDLTGRGIEVVLVAYPVSRGYLTEVEAMGAPQVWTHPSVSHWLDHPQVTFWNESETLAGRPELFYDGDHLEARGGRVFTAAVGRRLGLSPVAGSP